MNKTRLDKAIELLEHLEDSISTITYQEIYEEALELLYQELKSRNREKVKIFCKIVLNY